jgi:hypothetical protein
MLKCGARRPIQAGQFGISDLDIYDYGMYWIWIEISLGEGQSLLWSLIRRARRWDGCLDM